MEVPRQAFPLLVGEDVLESPSSFICLRNKLDPPNVALQQLPPSRTRQLTVEGYDQFSSDSKILLGATK